MEMSAKTRNGGIESGLIGNCCAAPGSRQSDTNNRAIDRIPGRFWGFAYLRPRSEKVAASRLAALGIPHYLPLIPKARMHHSTRIVTMQPMLPGYIFLCTDDHGRSELKRSEDKFIQIELMRTDCAEIQLVEELNALIGCEKLALEAPVRINPDIKAGDRVMITSGPLAGFATVVVRRNDGRNSIIVNLTILNRHVECPIAAADLEKITS